ncbi:cell division protein FtsQ [Mycolicibacillus koreensis]|nr:cell division protein FtsQ [Mycolicibacillus koreensis]
MTDPEHPPTEPAADDEAVTPAADDQAVTSAADEDDFEGPRRRARRERAERRAAQQRARAIEEARREAKRRLRGSATPTAARPVPRGAVRGLKMLLWGVLAVAVTVGLGLVLYFTPVMSVRTLDVVGLAAVTDAEVLDAAQVAPGTPLLQVDTDAVADRVATIRRVASARVQRQYPSTLRITIVERVPVAVRDFPDGPHLYDRDGVDFATGPPPPSLPYLDVATPGPTDPATTAALDVLTALRPEVVAQVGQIAAPSVASITLTLVDGRTVIWGTSDRTQKKADTLAALLTQPGEVYDVSSPDLPTVR